MGVAITSGDSPFFMKLIEFSHRLHEFIKTQSGGSPALADFLLEAETKYFVLFDQIDEDEFTHLKGLGPYDGTTRKKKMREDLSKLINAANDIIPRVVPNEYDQVEKFFSLFFYKNGTPQKSANIKDIKKDSLFRIVKADKYQILDRARLFVLTNDKLNYSGKYRFNPDGYPCIYMASTLYNAWEETRRPDFEMANFVRYKPMRNLQVMSIYIETQMQTYGDFVMAYFSLICAVKTKDEDNYHLQYVVPNLFMSILARSIRLKSGIDGIRYLSSRGYDGESYQFKSQYISEAFVFPPRIDDKGTIQWDHLKTLFRMTNPHNYFYYKIHRFDFGKGAAHVSEYQDSLFYAIEEQLKKEKPQSLK